MSYEPKKSKARLLEYIHRFKRIPGSTMKRDGFTLMSTIVRRFGTFNKALLFYGLPTKKKLGYCLTEYSFADGTKFYLKSGMGYEELYQIMLEKCPVLSN